MDVIPIAQQGLQSERSLWSMNSVSFFRSWDLDSARGRAFFRPQPVGLMGGGVLIPKPVCPIVNFKCIFSALDVKNRL